MSKVAKAAKKAEKAERKAVHRVASHRHAPPVRAAGFLAEIADQPQLIAISVVTCAPEM